MKSIIVKLLPKGLATDIKNAMESVDKRFIGLFAWSGVTSSLYYLLFSRKFDREHKAVLKGRIAYHKSLSQVGKSSALLRRNTHRLEKGLIMRPRRAVFGEAYIMETVNCYATAIKSSQICGDEIRWATDVLTEYFTVVDDTPKVAQAHVVFKDAAAKVSVGENSHGSHIPKARKLYPEPGVSTQSFEQLCKRRRSVRWFESRPVPDSALTEAINLASLAPSACNRQPYEFVVVNDMGLAPGIAKCAMGTAGFADNIPCIVAVVGDLNAYPAERDRHCIYIDASLAAMQFMLCLETMGLASCPINWPDIESRERMLSKRLDLNDHQRTVMLIAVGYADLEGGIPYSQKKTDAVLTRGLK